VVDVALFERAAPDLVERLRAEHSRPGDADYWKTLVRQASVMWLTPLGYAEEDFERIIVPTLVLVGDRDAWVPVDEAVRMYHLLTNGELAIVPDTAHDMPPALVTPIVLDFLLRHRTCGEQQ